MTEKVVCSFCEKSSYTLIHKEFKGLQIHICPDCLVKCLKVLTSHLEISDRKLKRLEKSYYGMDIMHFE